MFKFIHAADIHLDSPLRGLEQYEGAPVQQIRDAARRAFENLLDLAIEEKVAFIVIAGDLYDGDWRDYSTGLYLVNQVRRLQPHGIRLFLIAGNHDAQNKMTRSLILPDIVTFFRSEAAHTVTIDEIDVAVHGQSFANNAVYDDLSASYPVAIRGCFNIGLLHTCATGRDGHDRYAPCTLEGLKLKGYDYWALGHIHIRETLCEKPYIAFSGNVQGRHIRETGPKGALLVTVADDRTIQAEFRPLDVFRWHVATIELSQATTIDDLYESVRDHLRALSSAAEQRSMAIRIELLGDTPIHSAIIDNKPRIVNEIRSIANDAGAGCIWIEKVKIHTANLVHARRSEGVSGDAIGELVTLFNEVRETPSKLDEMHCSFADVKKKLSELTDQIPVGNTDWIREMLDEAESRLLKQLYSTEVDSN
jgi:DNA repair protein SbcD/Mre11